MTHATNITMTFDCQWAARHALDGENAMFALGNICNELRFKIINNKDNKAYKEALALTLAEILEYRIAAIGLINGGSDSLSIYVALCKDEFLAELQKRGKQT